jgi:16S rRNA (uracil1498-N3)-methyltransferase
MQRVFLSPDNFAGARVALSSEVAHYLGAVLRLRAGEEFLALDGSGAAHRVRLVGESPRLSGEIVETFPASDQPSVSLTLYQGLPKGKRLPLILQKATELGVAQIVPMLTARSQVRLAEQDTEHKLSRWTKIVTEAAEQCLRPQVPEVSPALDFAQALAHWQQSGAAGLLLDEALAGEPGRGMRQALDELGKPAAMALFIGPEGGLAPQESEAARAAGLLPVSLGARILRTETAAIVACALVMHEYGELG